MTKSEYEMLQGQLTRKMKNNPYNQRGLWKYGEGYDDAILTAKSILSKFYSKHYEKRNNEGVS